MRNQDSAQRLRHPGEQARLPHGERDSGIRHLPHPRHPAGRVGGKAGRAGERLALQLPGAHLLREPHLQGAGAEPEELGRTAGGHLQPDEAVPGPPASAHPDGRHQQAGREARAQNFQV